MTLMPFARLPAPRAVKRPDLPADLAEFYTRHEGVGCESPLDRSVRLLRLDEVARIGWDGLGQVADTLEGWEGFAGVLIGVGIFFERIAYVLDAPSCPPGSILAVGTILVGSEGGHGPNRIDGSVVLAATFADWLTHLERCRWEEPILAGMGDRPDAEYQSLLGYYRTFNPGLWSETGE